MIAWQGLGFLGILIPMGIIIATQEIFTSIFGKDHPAFFVVSELAVFAGAGLVAWPQAERTAGENLA